MSAQSENPTSTPEHAPKVAPPAVRRAFTAPTKLVDPSRTTSSAIPGAESVETLFVHPEAKVVSFTILKVSSRPSSSSGPTGSETKAVPWTSPTERTLAAGKAVLTLY